MTLSRFNVGGRATVFADLTSLDSALDATFAELADEIAHRVGEGTAPIAAVEETIADFRELLRECAAAEVPSHQIYGLIGELIVLRLLARFAPTAVEAWTGPFEQRHDFRRREHALEVKTSQRADAVIVNVSSIEQLAEPRGGSLTLMHVRVESADAGQISISDLVTELLQCGVPKRLLERGLGALGCHDPAASAWNKIRCHLEGISAYAVATGFPRIVAVQLPGQQLPEGVFSVQYQIDLRAARSFVLSDEGTEAALRRIAS